MWKDGSNNHLATGSDFIQTISSASSAAGKLKANVFINSSGNAIKFTNLRARLTYTPATALSTPFKRATSVISNTANIDTVGFLTSENILEEGGGNSTSRESGSIVVLRYPSFDVPTNASVIGYQFQGRAANQGSALFLLLVIL